MPQNILTAGNATSNQSLAAGDDGTFKIVVGPNGSQVDGLSIGATGNAAVAGTLTQAGVATPRMALATAQATTSGTAIDFTGIPSWVKRITFLVSGISTNGNSNHLIQLGAGSIQTTGYNGTAQQDSVTAGSVLLSSTTGFLILNNANTDVVSGMATFVHMGGNIWIGQGTFGRENGAGSNRTFYGKVALSGTLDRIRYTSVTPDTFDAGSVNILYEG